MKVFVTSDIHGNFNYLTEIITFIKNREDIHCIILCGDITGDYKVSSFSEIEHKQYEDYKRINEMLAKLNRKVLFIQGNHDVFNVDKTDTAYLPYNKDETFNNFIAIEYINFLMYGTKRECDEAEIKYRLSKVSIDNEAIIISHLPPYKCLDKANNGAHYGSTSIREMIKEKKPKYFFCGHVHNGFGFKKLYDTYVFNCACEEGISRGWVVDLETGSHENVIL